MTWKELSSNSCASGAVAREPLVLGMCLLSPRGWQTLTLKPMNVLQEWGQSRVPSVSCVVMTWSDAYCSESDLLLKDSSKDYIQCTESLLTISACTCFLQF